MQLWRKTHVGRQETFDHQAYENGPRDKPPHAVVGHIADVPYHVLQAEAADLPAKVLPVGRLDAGETS